MIFEFDYNKRYKAPEILVCNPNLDELESIAYLKNLKITPAFNAVSEVTFDTYEKYEDKYTKKLTLLPCYEHLKKNKILHILGFGYFVIDKTEEHLDGGVNTKSIHAYSYEFTLNNEYMNLDDGMYQLYNPITPDNTILGKIISVMPFWTIGHVDSELWSPYRYFEDVDGKSRIYSFMMSELEEAYGCIFDFDVENMTINAYTPNNIVSDTDIVLSFDSTIKDITITEDDSSIVTALYVAGSGDLTINNVNPLGTPFIYNYKHYETLDWMTQDLIDALTIWENKIESSRESYSNVLVNVKNVSAELIVLENALTDLTNELDNLEILRNSQMGSNTPEISSQIDAKNAEIKAKNVEITSKTNELNLLKDQLTAINTNLKPENNFTQSQWTELKRYTFVDSYQNDNYEVTDSMTNLDIMELTEELYQAGQEQLDLVSQPNFTFEMNAVNFLFSEKFLPYINQIKMGCKINVETEREWYVPILLKMVIDYDNPSNFSMTFGNRFRISNDEWFIRDLQGEIKSVSSSISGNTSSWSKGGLVANEFIAYKNNSLVAANQSIVNSKDITTEIGSFGLRSRKLLPDGTYSPVQIWTNNGMTCITDDNWQTTKIAIGIINGIGAVNAEVIAGDMLVGGQLKIYTENGSFTVDGDGAKLVNADLSLTSSNNRAKMYISPTDGIRIQTSTNGTSWDDKFYVDTTNNKLIFKGDLVSDSGTIGGWIINKDGLTSPYGDYFKSTGYGKLGLMTYTPTYAQFDGKIFGRNLDSRGVTTSKIDDEAITTDKVEDDAITPRKLDRLYATYGQFQSLVADVADIEDLVATKASISQLNAVSATVSSLQASMITTEYLESNWILVQGVYSSYGLTTARTVECGSVDCGTLFVDGDKAKWVSITDKDGDSYMVLGYPN